MLPPTNLDMIAIETQARALRAAVLRQAVASLLARLRGGQTARPARA
ncbi:MAG: hypothetical protein AAF366_11195 [Pseudomonadota bacterium]